MLETEPTAEAAAETAAPAPAPAVPVVTVALDAATRQQMATLQTQLETYQAERDRAEAVAVEQAAALAAAQDRLAAMEAAAQRARFTDLVFGRGDAGDGRRWLGESAGHVEFLTQLAGAFGEDSDAVRHYVALNRAHAEQAAAGGLFAELGRDTSGGTATADGQLWALADQLRQADPTLPAEQAYRRAADQRPDLFTRAVQGA